MPELRKDYVTDTWVIFAPLRSHRPRAVAEPRRPTTADACPFCEGHEDRTPPEAYAVRDHGPANGPGWRVRCVPNLFPALEPGDVVDLPSAPLFGRVSGVGKHEVIVESPDHDGNLGLMSSDQVTEVVRAYRSRYRDLAKDKRFRHVMIFKNHGERAGATFSHPHSQLIALPIVPARIRDELDAARRHHEVQPGTCVFCRIVATEVQEARRVVSQEGNFIAISPYAARFPFETWILPKKHSRTFEDLDDAMCASLATILRDVLGRIYHVLDNPDLNYCIHTAPSRDLDGMYHWHLEITPRISEVAGFERGTGMFINQVMPEDAAAILRGDVPTGIPASPA